MTVYKFINKEPRAVETKFSNNMDEVFYAETISKEELPAVPAFCTHGDEGSGYIKAYFNNNDGTTTCIFCGAKFNLMPLSYRCIRNNIQK